MRVREFIHRSGSRLRLVLDQSRLGEGPVIRLSDPARPAAAPVMLDLYGGELLAGFLMSARLSSTGDLSDEGCNGDYPLRLRLGTNDGNPVVTMDQAGNELLLVQPMWDRLYAELLLIIAHGRHLTRAGLACSPMGLEGRRLLH